MSSGLNFFTNEIDKTPGTINAWVDVDVTVNVPAGATGVILRLHNTDTATKILAVRKNGSTDTRTPSLAVSGHIGAMVGIDANRVFEAYIGSTLAKVMLIGYTTDGSDFLTNSVDLTPTVIDTWQDRDASASIPSGATGVVVEIQNSVEEFAYYGGVRKNGAASTVPLGAVSVSQHVYQACGVDANRVFEANKSNAGIKIWLVGYFMSPVTFETEPINKALANLDAWTDITYSEAPSDADGALWLVKNIAAGDYYGGTRKNGSTDNSYGKLTLLASPAFFTGLDASRIAEGKIGSANIDHYVIGYAKPVVTVTQKTVTDILALAEATPGITARMTITEALGVADTLPSGTPKAYLFLADALALVETITPKLFKSIADSLALADATPAVLAKLSLAESLALADAISALKVAFTLTDSLALADAVSVYVGAIQKSVTDALALTETLTLKAFLTLADQVSLAEAISLKANITLAEALGLVEAVAAKGYLTVLDTLVLAEVLSLKVTLSATDSLTLADAVSIVTGGAASRKGSVVPTAMMIGGR